MDQGQPKNLTPPEGAGEDGSRQRRRKLTRRRALKAGLCVVGGGGAIGAMGWQVYRSTQRDAAAEVFKGDAPNAEVWRLWNEAGWVKEAQHYRKLGRNVQCTLCPNECLLEPEDRSRCRNRVNKDGTLYTMAYANPCSANPNDPIEKKPLYHFLPATRAFSIATSGCSYRCLNCQNWTISQSKPEETVDPRRDNLPAAPADIVRYAASAGCASIAYTYSEPTVFFEYMVDTATLAKQRNIKNVWVTCGYINEKPLQQLCDVIDAANVDLKSFSDAVYRKLNSGKLQPVLDTLTTLKDRGVWFEVTNLVVPTYTDDLDMIRRMCDWLVDHIGPDYPLHFSRFHPQHKLSKLPPTPVDTLRRAGQVARDAGLRYVYIGNVPGEPDSGTTFCPECKRPIIVRLGYHVRTMDVINGACRHCQTPIAGVWKT